MEICSGCVNPITQRRRSCSLFGRPSEADFRYTMGQAIADGILCDYDLTVPVTTQGHPYRCLAGMLLSQAGRFRRVLAYCNSVSEAKRFQEYVESLGLAAWHMNGKTPLHVRRQLLASFTGPLQKPVHVLVTVQVLGEGVNIPNADTCMFVEPRNSYTSIIQAIGRVLRLHPAKPLAHIVLPGVAVVASNSSTTEDRDGGANLTPPTHASCPSDANQNPSICSSSINNAGSHQDVTQRNTRKVLSNLRGAASAARLAEARVRQGEHVLDVSTQIQASAETSCQHQQSEKSSSASRAVDAESRTQTAERMSSNKKDVEGGVHNHELPKGMTGNQLDVVASTLFPSSAQEESAPVQVDAAKVLANLEEQKERHLSEFLMPAGRKMRVRSKRTRVQSGSALRARVPMLIDESYCVQVERFLAAIASADSRLSQQTLTSRLRIVDARDSMSASTWAAISSDVFAQLTYVLQQEDPWEIRVQAVESFVSEHGILPVEKSSMMHEKWLGVWLRNVGVRVRKRILPAHRVQRLMNSTMHLLRARVWDWLGEDVVFQLRCNMLKDFVHQHGALPNLLKSSGETTAEQKLATFLVSLKKGSCHVTKSRLKLLKELHPLVSKLVESWQGSPKIVIMSTWQQRASALKSFVQQAGRLPNFKLETEKQIYWWLCAQKYRFLMLPRTLQDQLLDIPAVKEFVTST